MDDLKEAKAQLKEAEAQIARLRALCSHGGDDSRAYAGPGRTGICDACATKLLRENELMKQVMRDLSEERGLPQALRPTLEPVLRRLEQVREQVKTASFRLAYGGRITAEEERRMFLSALPMALGRAVNTLREVLALAPASTATPSVPMLVPADYAEVERRALATALSCTGTGWPLCVCPICRANSGQ